MAGKSCQQVLQAAWSDCIHSQEAKNDECLYWLACFYIVQDLIFTIRVALPALT